MISTQYVNLNMIPSGVMPVLYCSQYDIDRPLGLVVYNGFESVDLSGYTATIEATRTDKTSVTAAVVTEGNIGVFTTTATMTNENDTYRAKLVLVDGNSGRVASMPFVLCVNPKTMDENAEDIEEDASLYQQYTQTVQTIIASISADLAAEITARQNAVSAEATARQNAISAEASARQTADNTLQNNINAEASIRSTQDASLQSQIDQLIAPSGEAPSAAEVENARIGSDGTVYPTLGDAIRTQNSDLKSQINNTDKINNDFRWVQDLCVEDDPSHIRQYTRLDHILYNGTSFIANSQYYDSFVVVVYPYQTVKFTVASGEKSSTYVSTVKPEIGVTTSTTQITASTHTNNTSSIQYLLVMFKLASGTPKLNVEYYRVSVLAEIGQLSQSEYTESVISGINEKCTYTTLSNLVYNGTKFFGATNTTDSIIIRVKKSQWITIKINSGTPTNFYAFSSRPKIGEEQSALETIPTSKSYYFAEVDSYVMCMFNTSGASPSITVKYSDVLDSLGTAQETGTLTNDDFDNIIWNGTAYVSGNDNFNGFIARLTKGQTFSWTVGTGVQQSARVFTDDPIIGDTVSYLAELRSTAYTCAVDVCYLQIVFDIRNTTSVSMTYTRASGGLFAEAKKGMPLYGKKIVCFGDSITEFVDYNTQLSYSDYLSAMSMATVVKGGIGGTRMAQRTTPATSESPTPVSINQAYAALDLCNLIDAWVNNDWTVVDAANAYIIAESGDDNTAIINNLKNNPISGVDIVTIMIGGNDVSGGTVLGNQGSSNNSEYCGAMNNVIAALITAKPSIKIYCFTYIVKFFDNTFDDAHWSDNYENSTTHVSIPSMNTMIETVAQQHHLPCIDMYWSLGWNKTTFPYYLNSSRTDGSHPIFNEGLKIIASRFYGQLITNME